MPQSPLLSTGAQPSIPITGSSIGTDPGTTGIPGSPTDVEAALAALQAEIAAADVEVDDEGTPLTTAVASLDFVGSGVTATAVGDAVTVTIPGSSGIEVKEIDGAPDVTGVIRIVVPNGSLTDDTGGQVTIAFAGGGGDTSGQFIVGFDAGAFLLVAGKQQDVRAPFTGTITRWTIVGDAVGACDIDIWLTAAADPPTIPVVGDSITAGLPPSMSGAVTATSATLTGWTTAVNAGDLLRFNLNSVSGLSRVLLVVAYSRP